MGGWGLRIGLIAALLAVALLLAGCSSVRSRSRAPDFAYVSRDAMATFPDEQRYPDCVVQADVSVDGEASYHPQFAECWYRYFGEPEGKLVRGFNVQFGVNANGVSWQDVAGVQRRCSNEEEPSSPLWVSGNFVPGDDEWDTVGLFETTFWNTCWNPAVAVLTEDGEVTLLRFRQTSIDDATRE